MDIKLCHTLNMNKTNTKVRRPGAGRTLGSTSFVLVPLQELNDKLADKTVLVKVSRLWAAPFDLKTAITGTASELTSKTEGVAPGKGVSVTETAL